MSLPEPQWRRDPGAEVRAAARRTFDAWRGVGMVIVGVLVAGLFTAAVVALDYRFALAPHRVVKVALGVLAFALVAGIPRFGLLLMPCVYPYLGWIPSAHIPGINVLNMLTFMVFGSFALTKIFRREPIGRMGRLTLPILAITVLAALSIVRAAAAPTGYTYDMFSAIVTFVRTLPPLAMYFITYSMARGAGDRQRITWAVLVGLALESFTTMQLGRNGSGGRAIGSLGQSNELGAFLALYAAVAIAIAMGSRNWLEKILAFGVFCLGGYGVMLSLSRGSMLAIVAGIAVVAARTSKWAIALVIVAAATGPLWMPDYVIDRINSTRQVSDTGDDVSVDMASEARLETWKSVLKVVEGHPIDGVGFTGLLYVLPDMGDKLGLEEVKDSAHNTFLRMLAEMGVFGFATFVWLLVAVWRLGDGAVRRAKRPFDRALGVGLCGAVVTMAISCAFGDRFYSPPIASSFWVVCALAEDVMTREGAERPA